MILLALWAALLADCVWGAKLARSIELTTVAWSLVVNFVCINAINLLGSSFEWFVLLHLLLLIFTVYHSVMHRSMVIFSVAIFYVPMIFNHLETGLPREQWLENHNTFWVAQVLVFMTGCALALSERRSRLKHKSNGGMKFWNSRQLQN